MGGKASYTACGALMCGCVNARADDAACRDSVGGGVGGGPLRIIRYLSSQTYILILSKYMIVLISTLGINIRTF